VILVEPARRCGAAAAAADASAALQVLARAEWPETAHDDPAALAPIPGFVISTFNPLVAAVAARCLERRTGQAPPCRTALVLASASGDVASARELADAVRTGRRVAPLLFFQSNPNAVLGHVAARHRLDGPLVCLGPAPGRIGPRERALAEAALLLLDEAADEVLVLLVEQGPDAAADADRAEALLVRAAVRAEAAPDPAPPAIPPRPGPGEEAL
jgi:hypothetical protein